MPKIIAVANLKGGVGKTTIALNLASALAGRRKAKVGVIDLDLQKSAMRWARQGQGQALGFPVAFLGAGAGAIKFKNTLDQAIAQSKTDILILDTPPQLADPTMLAALTADFVLTPVGASPLDLWAAGEAVALVDEARQERGDKLPLLALVPSKLKAGTVLARELPARLAEMGPVAPIIHDRVAIIESAVLGQTVTSYAPGSPAHLEFEELGRYVLQRLKEAD
ncbi:Cobyrinic acid ac-diamide synthase [Desulfarculus baarsii DSM 2075]|uniref:Cobyrinic acid ac-diamide synthase n=1 Tax=Desulfarculus baarsii (strain ATCC 33931 / DSM 2075 / LMG 7858 / VKM B-1802 / 2st14) TaxID=644282 RepID=E1QH19_DESB2|nr:ParA family protein [Desulfarculus baarsii]ADK84862.1 Cobyrinic acid ac-diamide synthase [Desulfarculus baarsii DSM 2075]